MNSIAKIQEKLCEKGLDALLIRDEKNQRYACGFPFSDGSVLVSRKGAWMITDSRYIEAAEKAAPAGVKVLMFDREHSQNSLISAALREAGAESLGAEEGKLSHRDFLALEKALGLSLSPAQEIFDALRQAKTEEEIAAITEAQRISERALEQVLHIIKPGMSESELAAELVYHMLKEGSEGNSFDPIVVTGSKTSLPHGVPGDQLIQKGDFVTMDFGSLKRGYCSDMTRTVAVGRASQEMKNVYSVVLEAQLAGIAAARAGVPGREVDGAGRAVIEKAGFGQYFGHGFGHSLGLDIHEAPNANPSGDSPLPAGAVISAEPGIYLPGRFGVRIEDILVVREAGAQVITQAPKELTVL